MNSRGRKLWGTVDEAIRLCGIMREAFKRRMIPMSYYPEPMEGHIRFRVMGPRRTTKVSWADVLALQPGETNDAMAEEKKKRAAIHPERNPPLTAQFGTPNLPARRE